MHIVLRADGSAALGLGHMARQVSLRQALLALGQASLQVTFALRHDSDTPAALGFGDAPFVQGAPDETEAAFVGRVLQELEPDLLVLDGKGPYPEELVAPWRRRTRLAFVDIPRDVFSPEDLNVFPNGHYTPKNPEEPVLHGLPYTLLSSAVLALPQRWQAGGDALRPLCVTTGGSDPANVMGRIVEALAQRPPPFPCVFLLGRAFRHRQALLERAKRLPATFAFREHDWAEILRARATFCAFGVSIYELLALGVPCAVTAHSRENDEGARVLCQRFPVVPYLGFEETLTHESMLGALAQLEATPAEAWAPFAVMKQATTHVAQKLLAFASVAKGGRPPLGP